MVLSSKDIKILIDKLNFAKKQLADFIASQSMTPREKLIRAARKALNTDASYYNRAPSTLACAEAVSTILKQVFPDFPIIVSTAALKTRFLSDKRFERIYTEPVESDILLYATDGTFHNGIKNGHVFIGLGNNRLGSNTSKNGKFEDNYSLDAARRYWKIKGGYEEYVFRLL